MTTLDYQPASRSEPAMPDECRALGLLGRYEATTGDDREASQAEIVREYVGRLTRFGCNAPEGARFKGVFEGCVDLQPYFQRAYALVMVIQFSEGKHH